MLGHVILRDDDNNNLGLPQFIDAANVLHKKYKKFGLKMEHPV